jgi:flagellar biosynthesis/type III secretory pathway M-ring protein FliF/YscJ
MSSRREPRLTRRERIEWWRMAILALLTLMVATVAYGTLQTARLVQDDKADDARGEQIMREAFARLDRIDEAVAHEFQDHRKRAESGNQCLVEIITLIHKQPPDSVATLLKVYNQCIDRVSGGTPPADGVDTEHVGGE